VNRIRKALVAGLAALAAALGSTAADGELTAVNVSTAIVTALVTALLTWRVPNAASAPPAPQPED
jgi:hypothetical protein